MPTICEMDCVFYATLETIFTYLLLNLHNTGQNVVVAKLHHDSVNVNNRIDNWLSNNCQKLESNKAWPLLFAALCKLNVKDYTIH